MTAILCSGCGRAFGGQGAPGRVASIAGSIMGDEYVDTYYFCDRCAVYTVEHYHDRFSGEEGASVSGPLPRASGDAKVAIIRRCSTPFDKTCRCQAHLDYFGGSLD